MFLKPDFSPDSFTTTRIFKCHLYISTSTIWRNTFSRPCLLCCHIQPPPKKKKIGKHQLKCHRPHNHVGFAVCRGQTTTCVTRPHTSNTHDMWPRRALQKVPTTRRKATRSMYPSISFATGICRGPILRLGELWERLCFIEVESGCDSSPYLRLFIKNKWPLWGSGQETWPTNNSGKKRRSTQVWACTFSIVPATLPTRRAGIT